MVDKRSILLFVISLETPLGFLPMCAVHPRLPLEKRAILEKRITEIEARLNAKPDATKPRSRLATEWEALLDELADLKEELDAED
jgi:hypothetical protein